MAMTSIAFITGVGRYLEPSANLIQPDDDIAAAELRRRDVNVEGVIWSDPAADWLRYDLLILRSCWDYHRSLDGFYNWIARIERTGGRLLNEPELVRWNSHKSYLLDLQSRGIAITPTEVIPRGSGASISDIMRQRGWNSAVLKPAVSLAGENAFRGTLAEISKLETLYAELGPQTDLLLQEFCEAVIDEGEWSCVFIDGEFSHSFLKRPAGAEFRVNKYLGGNYQSMAAPAEVVAFGRDVLATLPVTPLYARVDAVRQDSRVILFELELIEPSLYFGFDPQSARTFADAVLRRL